MTRVLRTAAAVFFLPMASAVGAVSMAPVNAGESVASAELGTVARAEWRLAAGLMPAYEVTKEESERGALQATYEWLGTAERAPLIAAQYGQRIADAPFSWGVELKGSWRELRPRSYRSGGKAYANLDGEHLVYHSATLALTGTWQAVRSSDERLAFLVDVQASLGPTVLAAHLANSQGSDRSVGYGGDASVRLIAGLSERRWQGAILLGWCHGVAITEFKLPSYRSEFQLERSGIEAAVMIGHMW